MRTPHTRPFGEGQKDYYAGKDKKHSLNTVAAVSHKGAFVYGSAPLLGSWNDIVMVDGLAGPFPRVTDPARPGGRRYG